MDNLFLTGNLAPVTHEHTATDLAVTGTIPDHLDGRYVRNGPNPLGEIDPVTYNWFTGDGMVHGVRIRDGRAQWYRNRWVRTPRVRAALGEPRLTTRRRAGEMRFLGANTNVIAHGGRTLALVEGGPAAMELTEELDTVGPCDFDGTLAGGYTAHPKRDPATGELHAVSYSIVKANVVQYSVIGADGRANRTVDIGVGGSPMMHNFSLTENYVVLYDLPVTLDPGLAVEMLRVPRPLRLPARLVLSALIGRIPMPDPVVALLDRRLRPNHRLPYRWNPDYRARVGVLPRGGGADQVRWFDVEPCYVFHPLNAYEDGDTIVVDLARHATTFDTNLTGPVAVPSLDRWTIDLSGAKGGTVREERLDDRGQEFPRVDDRLLGRRHRYGYTVAGTSPERPRDALLKHDFKAGAAITRDFGATTYASEFAFVPARPDAAEDDGVLMGFIHDTTTERSDLLLLDAGTLETAATIHLPHRVPGGFHGDWLPTNP
jgi:carotenoid cleavage oxygenase